MDLTNLEVCIKMSYWGRFPETWWWRLHHWSLLHTNHPATGRQEHKPLLLITNMMFLHLWNAMKSSPPPQTARVCERCGLEGGERGLARHPSVVNVCMLVRPGRTEREWRWKCGENWFCGLLQDGRTSPPPLQPLPPPGLCSRLWSSEVQQVLLFSAAWKLTLGWRCRHLGSLWQQTQTSGLSFLRILFSLPNAFFFYTPQSFIPQIDIWVCDPLSNSAGEWFLPFQFAATTSQLGMDLGSGTYGPLLLSNDRVSSGILEPFLSSQACLHLSLGC